MDPKKNLNVSEALFIILLSITVIYILGVYSNRTNNRAERVRTITAAKSIGLTMIAYAEDDIKHYKMPFPLPEGKEKIWGNSKEVWSTSVAEMLFKQKYFRKGEESQLQSAGATSKRYKPMYLNDNTIVGDKYWSKKTALDFHLYCDKDLTSTKNERRVLVATYDNDDIRNCQFNGTGWVVFFSNKTTEFISRTNLRDFEFDFDSPKNSLNLIDGSLVGPGIVLRKNIPASEGGPGTFGNFWGGGSTELMGKIDTDPIYKKLVR